MSEVEGKLATLWPADAPPARDAAFRFAVQARLEKRRVRIKLAALALIGAAATVFVWRAAPVLDGGQAEMLGAALGALALGWAGVVVAARLQRGR